jgi:agmatine deiminase
MKSRRIFLKFSLAFGGSLLMAAFNSKAKGALKPNQWFMPEESGPHKRTWMSFIASYDIWEERQVKEVQRNLALIAKTIAKYEPVSILVRKKDYKVALRLIGGLDSHNYPIELVEFKMNDLWIRDTGPAFVVNEMGEKFAVNFNFNGWGGDQDYQYDAKVSDFVAKKSGVKSIYSNLVLEGGCFELDG